MNSWSPSIRARAAILFLVLAMALSIRSQARAEAISTADAYKIIAEAAANQRRVPAYSTTSSKEHGRGTEKTVRIVCNRGTALQLFREEVTIALPRLPLRTSVLIQNDEGLWHHYSDVNLRLLFPFGTERPIPLRLESAQLLCFRQKILFDESRHVVCTIDRDVEHFGIRASRLTVSLAPELQQLAVGANASAPSPAAADVPAGPARDLPTSFVYYIARDTPFILSWQAYVASGAKSGEVVYQDFHVMTEAPADAFVVPSASRTLVAQNRDEYFRALRDLPGPAAKAK